MSSAACVARRRSPCLLGNILPCQHPCARCLYCVVHFCDVALGPFPPQELLAGKEPVHHKVQCQVQSVQEIHLSLAVVPVIPHGRVGDRVVLLFHVGVVVPLVRTGTVKVMSRAWQKRTRCPGVDSLPLSEWREMTFPAYLRRQDSSAVTTYTSAFVRTAPASVHPVVQSVTVRVHPKSPTACPPPRPTRSTARTPGMGRGGPCTFERESCHPEECSGYDRARADGTSVSPPSGTVPPRPDSSGGEAAVSRPPHRDAHVL